MIEAYSFLAVFTVQILAMSVLLPAWFIRHLRRKSPGIPAERIAQLSPGVDPVMMLERRVSRFRAVNTVIAVLGVLLMGWFFRYTQRADWDDGPVEALVGAYFMLQALPLCLIAWLQLRFKKRLLEHSQPDAKRTATLRRRGLLDFVSPFSLLLAGACYLGFVAFVLYIQRQPFPGFAGAGVNIGMITFLYAMEGFCVYRLMYGRKINRLETDADSVRMIGVGVQACIYVCIVSVAFLAINFTLVLRDMQRWEPFAQSVSLVITALLAIMALTAPTRDREARGFGPRPAA